MAESENDLSNGEQGNKPAGFSIISANREDAGDTPKKRGRPPGVKNRSKTVEIPSKAQADSSPNQKLEQIESAKFLGLGLVSLVELAEGFVHNSCENKIRKKLPERLAEFKELAEKVSLKDKDAEIIQTSVEKIAMRHDWMTKFAPEVLLCITLSQYSLRQMSLVKFVNTVTKEKPPEPTAKD